MKLPIPEMAKRKPDDAALLKRATAEAIAILLSYKQDKLDMYDRMRKWIELVRRLSKNDIKKMIKLVDASSELKQIDNK